MKKLHRIVLITAAMSLVFGLALATVSEAQTGPRGLKANDEGKPAWGPRGRAGLKTRVLHCR